MRIPVYTAQGAATTEAPGRSIRSRMNAQPFIAAAQAQGNLVSTVAEAAGQYAETRYKVLTENQLNEALLGADETLRTRAEELAQSSDYGRALDGDDPIWNRETEEIRGRLLDQVGGDVYARSQFEARFGQLELQNRFRLRGAIDRRIQADAAASYTQSLIRLEQDIANGGDLAELDLAVRTSQTTTGRAVAAGAVNAERADAALRTAIANGLSQAASRMAGESSAPIRFLDNVRTALTSGDPANLDANGLYLFGAMQNMTLEEQQDILSGTYRTVEFMFAETQEEIINRRIAENTASQAGDQASALLNDLSSGNRINPDSVQAAIDAYTDTRQFLSPEDDARIGGQIRELQFISGIANTLNQVGDPAYVDNMVRELENPESGGIKGEGIAGVDTDLERSLRNFLTNYAENMRNTIADDPISWARQTGAVNVGEVNLSAGAISAEVQGQADATGLAQRISDAQTVAARYGRPIEHIFGKADAEAIVGQIDLGNFEVAIAQVSAIQNGLGQYAGVGIRELEQAGLPPELTEALYATSATVQRELVQVAGVELSALREGLPNTVSNDINRELQSGIEDYRIAFEAGGDGSAVSQFNSLYAVAEKLALSRIRTRGVSPAEAASSVIKDLLPPQENWINERNQLYIVPREFDSRLIGRAASFLLTEQQLRAADIQPMDNPAFGPEADLEVNIGSLIDNGVWLNNSTGDGVILHYDINGQYEQALKSDGTPYEMKFVDAPGFAQAMEDLRMQRAEGL